MTTFDNIIYENLKREFEEKLNRPLTIAEEEFLEWVTVQYSKE